MVILNSGYLNGVTQFACTFGFHGKNSFTLFGSERGADGKEVKRYIRHFWTSSLFANAIWITV